MAAIGSIPCAVVFEADTSARFVIHQILVKLGWASFLPPAFERRLIHAFAPALVIVGRTEAGIDRADALAAIRRETQTPIALIAAFDDCPPSPSEARHADILIDRPLSATAMHQALRLAAPQPA